ncbi:hypothetical protein EJB05_41901, partial [Eragrostis curvula]
MASRNMSLAAVVLLSGLLILGAIGHVGATIACGTNTCAQGSYMTCANMRAQYFNGCDCRCAPLGCKGCVVQSSAKLAPGTDVNNAPEANVNTVPDADVNAAHGAYWLNIDYGAAANTAQGAYWLNTGPGANMNFGSDVNTAPEAYVKTALGAP